MYEQQLCIQDWKFEKICNSATTDGNLIIRDYLGVYTSVGGTPIWLEPSPQAPRKSQVPQHFSAPPTPISQFLSNDNHKGNQILVRDDHNTPSSSVTNASVHLVIHVVCCIINVRGPNSIASVRTAQF